MRDLRNKKEKTNEGETESRYADQAKYKMIVINSFYGPTSRYDVLRDEVILELLGSNFNYFEDQKTAGYTKSDTVVNKLRKELKNDKQTLQAMLNKVAKLLENPQFVDAKKVSVASLSNVRINENIMNGLPLFQEYVCDQVDCGKSLSTEQWRQIHYSAMHPGTHPDADIAYPLVHCQELIDGVECTKSYVYMHSMRKHLKGSCHNIDHETASKLITEWVANARANARAAAAASVAAALHQTNHRSD